MYHVEKLSEKEKIKLQDQKNKIDCRQPFRKQIWFANDNDSSINNAHQ